MYWTSLYSLFLYWSNTIRKTIENLFDIDLIWFNWYDFSDIIISNIPDSYDKNSIDIQTFNLSTHWQWFSNWLIKDKTLTIEWWILANSLSELEEKIRKIKANLLVWEWVLYLKKENWILQTRALVSNLYLPRERRTINSAQISITFKILDPFFYSLKQKEVWYFDVNASLTATLLYSSWTHETKPSVFISFKEAFKVSHVILKINDKTLIVNEAIKTWDSLSINAERLDVAKNWKYWKDWLWEFWELKTWENTINLSFNWEFNTEIFIKYRDTYV
jgi:hypothetical protein